MKRFVAKIGLLIILLLIAVFALVFKLDRNDYFYAYSKKVERLDSLQNVQKLVLLGGSNLAFGINSSKLQTELNIPVVNMGLHAGLGLRFQLDDILSKVDSLDYLVIAPEYDNFLGKGAEGDINTLTHMFVLSPAHMKNLTCDKFKEILFRVPQDICRNSLAMSNRQSNSDWSYSANNFNYLGDEVGHLRYNKIFKPLKTQYFASDFNHQFSNYFVEKISQLADNGVRIILVPPVIQESYYMANRLKVKEIVDELGKRGVDFHLSPDSTALSDNNFFDTVYHANKTGVELYTEMILNVLN